MASLADFLKKCEEEATIDRDFINMVKDQELSTRKVRNWQEKLKDSAKSWECERENIFTKYVSCQVITNIMYARF